MQRMKTASDLVQHFDDNRPSERDLRVFHDSVQRPSLAVAEYHHRRRFDARAEKENNIRTAELTVRNHVLFGCDVSALSASSLTSL